MEFKEDWSTLIEVSPVLAVAVQTLKLSSSDPSMKLSTNFGITKRNTMISGGGGRGWG